MIPHHDVTGPEDAPVLVLSNSLGTTLDMWNPQVKPLSERFRLIRYDMRGHGGSEIPDGQWSIDDLGGDVLDLLDHLGIEQAHFAGISLGGMVTLWLGINAPERVGRLVPICTSAKLGPASNWVDRAKTVREQGTEAIVDATMERWFTEAYRSKHPLTGLKAMFTGIDDEGYARCCGVIERMDLTDGLPNIRATTLVVAAAQDPATPPEPHTNIIVSAIPGAHRAIIDPGAHLINVERAGEINRLLVTWMEG